MVNPTLVNQKMYKDEPIKLSIDGEEDEYEFDENKLQYRKGHKPKVAARIHKNRSKRGGGNCSDYICKKSIRYRFGYGVALAIVLALVFTTPRTTLWLAPDYNTYNTPSVVAFGTVLFIMLLSYWIVQNSDPGFLTDIISPDDAVMYSTDAFRAHLYKSEWGDEDDGTWDESVKHIMVARSKFTDEDLEKAEREAELSEEKRRNKKKKHTKQPAASQENTRTPTDIEAVDVNDSSSSTSTSTSTSFPIEDEDDTNNKHRGAHGEDSEIEGLLLHDSAIGTKIKAYRIDTKHPDLPYRAIYCKAERRWIAMFDHYCGVLGTPIGEKNHARFWWYLCIQTMSLCYAIGIVHSGFRNSIFKDWYSDNAYHLWVVIVLYILTVFVGSLWIFHTWLACSNTTR